MTLDRVEIRNLASRMQRVAGAYRRANPLTQLPPEGGCYLVPSSSGGKPFSLPLVWYPSTACRWSQSGGCTMCNFGASEEDLPLSTIDDSVVKILDALDPGLQGIFFAPGGSFFNESELSADARENLCNQVARFPFLRMVGVETRPSYVTEERVLNFTERLPDSVQYFVIGMGLESVTPLVREVAVNKGNDLPAIGKAIENLKTAQSKTNRRLGFELYILLKPPFLSERESVEDAVRSIEWAVLQGADTVGLFVNVVKPQTLCHFLWNETSKAAPYRYQPAWWHSAFEVLRQLTPETAGRVQVLGPTSEVAPIAGPRCCPLCEEFLSGTITAWNFYRDQNLLSQPSVYSCSCHDAWQKEMRQDLPPLEERIGGYMEELELRVGSF